MIQALSSPKSDTQSRLFEAAKGLESNFMSMMLQTMFEGISCEGIGKGGMGEHMFRSMLINEYASTWSQTNDLGIAEAIAERYASTHSQTQFLSDLERANDGAKTPTPPPVDLKV